MERRLDIIFDALRNAQLTVSEFLTTILTCRRYGDHYIVEDVLKHSLDIFDILIKHPSSSNELMHRCTSIVWDTYLEEIRAITSADTGWHFSALNATTVQLEEFDLEDMGRDMEDRAPGLWSLLGVLLNGGTPEGGTLTTDTEGGLSEADDDYWEEIEEIDLEGFIDGLTCEGGLNPPLTPKERRARHSAAIKVIVSFPLVCR